MSPSLKHLHDALLILEREERQLTNTIQLASTDINDSQANFDRRLNNIVQHQAELEAQVAKLLTQFDHLEAERKQMLARRENGPAGITEARQKLKQLDINRKTIQLAILQLELNGVQQ